jgi:hypothetical protein
VTAGLSSAARIAGTAIAVSAVMYSALRFDNPWLELNPAWWVALPLALAAGATAGVWLWRDHDPLRREHLYILDEHDRLRRIE